MLNAYIDESRSGDKRIFAVGGWLCCEKDGAAIENEWKQRIEYENRLSAKKGFPPITRFKAADLSNLQGEYAKSKGWSRERQTRFIKRLVQILTRKRHEPVVGFAITAIMDNWQIAYKNYEWAEKNVYHILFLECVHLIGEAMRNRWPNDHVSVFHDHGPFNESAQASFRSAVNDVGFKDRDFLLTVEPRKWQDCIALQPSDLLAYEGQKSAHLSLRISNDKELQRRYRKSLQKLLMGNLSMRGVCFTRIFEGILELRRSQNTYPARTAANPPM